MPGVRSVDVRTDAFTAGSIVSIVIGMDSADPIVEE
jgi:hypothetical protein